MRTRARGTPPGQGSTFYTALLTHHGDGGIRPSWRVAGTSPPLVEAHLGSHETALMPASCLDQSSFGAPYPWSLPHLMSIQSLWSRATGMVLGSSAVENSTGVGCGGVFCGSRVGTAYGAVLFWTTQQFSLVAKPKPPPYTCWRALENGKLPVAWTWLGVFASSSLFICSQISFATA